MSIDDHHFEYSPVCSELSELTSMLASGRELSVENETTELAHLRYALNINTAQLYSELLSLKITNEMKEELIDLLTIVTASETDPKLTLSYRFNYIDDDYARQLLVLVGEYRKQQIK